MSAFWLWLAYLLSFIQLACVSVSLLLSAACCPVGKHWAGNFNTPYVQPQGIEVSMVKQTEWQGSVRAMVPLSPGDSLWPGDLGCQCTHGAGHSVCTFLRPWG